MGRIHALIVKATALLAVTGLISAMLLTGCETQGSRGNDVAENPPPAQESNAPPDYEMPYFPIPSAPGIKVEQNDKALIDFSNMRDGYVMAKSVEEADRQVRLILTIPDGTEYTYRLTPGGGFDIFPLSGGNGEYLVRIFEQVEGTKYGLVLSVTIEVVMDDEFAPFLRPNQFVNFNRDSEVVRRAAKLTSDVDGLMERIAVIYNFVISNIEYDTVLAETVQSGYLPDLDLVLERGLGICFDYAAVMTAMLRSQGIPTKLVIGFTGEAYHAWISVFSEETGWIDDLIFFDGAEWKRMDPTFASSGQTAELVDFIGDGTNYHAKFFH